MYPCCIYGAGAGRNDFDVGYIHFEGHRKGWALKIETLLGPEMAPSEVCAHLGPKKVLHLSSWLPGSLVVWNRILSCYTAIRCNETA
jgi:hypothetical protein